MQGKVIVITGATSGIGQVAAESLARQGARMILVARDRARADATMEQLRRAGPDCDHGVYFADLSVIKDTQRVAAEIAAAEPQIDVLINNAGAMFNHRTVSADGLEMTFALNHMAYFVLTLGLQARLQAAGNARVVNTASIGHRGMELDFNDLQSTRSYSGFKAYGRSKLCNVLFTRECARRLQGTGITVNCLHPGLVATRFGDNSGGLAQVFMPLAKLFGMSPQKGADTLIYLASSPEVAATTGQYFVRRRAIRTSRQGEDEELAKKLWDESLHLAQITT